MNKSLTPKEQAILSYIKEFIRNRPTSPTLEEIRKHFGYDSLNSVQKTIVSLEKKGEITRKKFKRRNISLTSEDNNHTFPIPIIGNVACGAPILASENIEGYFPTDTQFLKGSPKKYFYLHARGDSMDNAGIHDGDLVLIHQQTTANDGDQVVALINDSATIKILKKGKGYIALVPKSSNSEHKPIILRENFSVQGIVVHSFQL